LADCKPEGLKDAVTKKLVSDARRQIEAATMSSDPEARIEWHVVNREMAAKIESILNERLPRDAVARITVIYTPDLVN
jgi:hypothetical protein